MSVRLGALLLLMASCAPAHAEPPRAERPDLPRGTTPILGQDSLPPSLRRNLDPIIRSAISLGCATVPVTYLQGEPVLWLKDGKGDLGFALVTDPQGRWALLVLDETTSRLCEMGSGDTIRMRLGALLGTGMKH